MTLSNEQPVTMYPWDIETFFVFSIVSNEWKADIFDRKNTKVFFDIMSQIEQYQETALKPFLVNPEFYSCFHSPICLQQYEIQETVDYKLFRYNYIFNFQNEEIDMKTIFYDKFKCDYSDFQLLSIALWLHYQRDDFNANDVASFFAIHYKTAFNSLLISRDDYLDELNKVTTTIEEYYFCFKPSFKYSFVEYDREIYFPLPHLIIRNCTTALLYRLTEQNNPLREKIGKSVLERYLYEIILDSNIFDEVYSEIKYKRHGTSSSSSDVLARVGDDFVFLECKSFSPEIDIRLCNEISINKSIKRLSEGCQQLYKQLTTEFPMKYNPFVSSVVPTLENLWGILVVLEDSYIERSTIYERTAELLRISIASDEYRWLSTHIGIVPLYSVERYCFTRTSFMDNIKDLCATREVDRHWLFGKIEGASIQSKLLIDFRQQLKSRLHKLGMDIKNSSYD